MPSTSRRNGTLAGITITIAAWMAAAIANPGWSFRNRATTRLTASVIASCHQPMPAMSTMSSATRMPTIMPITVSSTRRGRASRTSPRLDTVTVAARSGAA